jgi:predicted CoA-binding protein
VLGASVTPDRPAFYVPAYLHAQGHRILPVNPMYVGQELFGQRVVSSLAELREPVHLIDVFRRTELIAAHVPEILAMRPLPAVVWFQLGLRDDPSAERLRTAGIEVVQDRCTLADHQRYVT